MHIRQSTMCAEMGRSDELSLMYVLVYCFSYDFFSRMTTFLLFGPLLISVYVAHECVGSIICQ